MVIYVALSGTLHMCPLNALHRIASRLLNIHIVTGILIVCSRYIPPEIASQMGDDIAAPRIAQHRSNIRKEYKRHVSE